MVEHKFSAKGREDLDTLTNILSELLPRMHLYPKLSRCGGRGLDTQIYSWVNEDDEVIVHYTFEKEDDGWKAYLLSKLQDPEYNAMIDKIKTQLPKLL